MNDYVTDRELTAHLEPMKSDIRDLKDGMETVVAYVNQQKGAKAVSRRLTDRRIAVVALGGAVLSAMWWVPDAIAKFGH